MSYWRNSAANALVKEIEEAQEKYRINTNYEKHGNRLATTLIELTELSRRAAKFASSLKESMSPIGQSALFELGLERQKDFGRYGLATLTRDVAALADCAELAADQLKSMHSPTGDFGQGSGSSIGRDSDLRAIRADHDDFRRGSKLPAFRSPKDKLGVAVIAALVRHGSAENYVFQRGGALKLTRLLDSVLEEVEPHARVVWTEVVRARSAIAAMVKREAEAAAFWDTLTGEGWASSGSNPEDAAR